MIYDTDRVENLIRQYQEGKERVLEEILEESRSLVEVLVTPYTTDDTEREDLIQECFIKIMKVLPRYNPDVGNAHSYFTTVIRNCCNDYINKINKQKRLVKELKIEPERFEPATMPAKQEHLLVELKERNRRRFPSIPVDELDTATEFIFHCMINGIHGKSQGAIKELNETYEMNRHTAMILYHSSLVYLRHKYHREARPEHVPPKEISLLPELKEIIGEEAYEHLSVVLSGMYVRFP